MEALRELTGFSWSNAWPIRQHMIDRSKKRRDQIDEEGCSPIFAALLYG